MDETREDLYRRHADDLVRFATGLVGPFDAPGVVMDAVMGAFLSPSWSGVGNHRAYLYRCVFNRARTHYRSALSRRVREQRAAVPATIEQSLPDLDVLETVSRLSMRQRAVVVLTIGRISQLSRSQGPLRSPRVRCAGISPGHGRG
jgi:RNA polymerase sigma-70 factor (ECF subfamily)